MSRLSHRGTIAAFTAATGLAVALLAWAGGESWLAVVPASIAGVIAGVLVVRDRRGARLPAVAHIVVGAACGIGALASLPNEQWLTAVALGGIGLMNVGTAVGWRMDAVGTKTEDEPEE